MKYIFLLSLCSCAFVPVFEGDYVRNQGEIKEQFEETKGKISDNAEMINTIQNVTPEVAKVITQRHAQEVSEWSKEPVDFTAPTGGNTMMNLLMGALTLSGLGGAGLVRKVMTLKSDVVSVAGMDGKAGIKEAKKRGYKV